MNLASVRETRVNELMSWNNNLEGICEVEVGNVMKCVC